MDIPKRETIEAAINARFVGPAGIEELKRAYALVIECAQAQAPMDETVASLVAECGLTPKDARLVFAFAAEDVEMAALAAKSKMRREIVATCRSETPSAARVALLREFAFQHLDWTRKPMDQETADALKEADKIRRQGTSGG